jgi:two-component system cell cycle sensor histidine kinase/response regulator CckA
MEKKILVVDNHPLMLKWMTNLLEKEGHQVLGAEDGLSALNILKTFTPEIIFTDLIMPNIDGERFCQIVRKDLELKEVFLVVLSATAAEEKADITQLGADLYIAKCSFDKMAKHVRVALSEADRRNTVVETRGVIGIEDTYPRQITKELLSFRKHFEIILKSMAEGILEITPQGRIVYCNPSAISLVGIHEEKLLASNLIDLFHDHDRERMRTLLSTLNTHRKTVNGDPPLRLNGKQVSLCLLPILDEESRTTIILINDVSERKEMEAQLLQAQKMEAIGTLAGGIAHDFNNLLMAIQGNISLLLLAIDPIHPHYERLKSVERQVQSGSKLTSQLLAFARKGRYDIKPVDLNRLVEETSDAFGRTRKEITIHRELAPDLFPIEADYVQIEQVLLNLLVNAADAMPGNGDLFLKTANVAYKDIQNELYAPATGKYVLLSVTDTGIGMDRRTMDRIFDPFFTTKEIGRGTGLGLASVYGIIKGHNGYISVQSQKGKGSTFMIYLPASEKEVEESAPKGEEILKGTEAILLIDDEKNILEVGEKILRALGYTAYLAESGEKAIDLYRLNKDKIDLVILDMIMPQKGGGETFDALKAINPEIKVLLSSGYSINGQATEIIKRGCSGFIQKPFTLRELSQKIREILNKPR